MADLQNQTEFFDRKELNYYKNYAFISYSHKDAKVARLLQHKLEQYVIPKKVLERVDKANLPPDGGHNFRPIFLDETDLTTGFLQDSLKENLDRSKYLIVICSPNSAKSNWVSLEVQHFIDTGRLHQIIPFVIDGVPFKDLQIAAGKFFEGDECMPEPLVKLAKADKTKELLGISLKEGGFEKSCMRIISQMLGVDFDFLWDRQARRKRIQWGVIISVSIVLLFVAGYFFAPIKLKYTVIYGEADYSLPLPEDAQVVIEGTTFNLGTHIDTTIVLKTRPGYYRGRKLPVEFHATYFDTIRTTFYLGHGTSAEDILYVSRNNTFAVFAGRVIDDDGEPVVEARVAIQQNETRTDEEGKFYLLLPPEDQAETQAIIIDRAGYHNVFRPDECPSDNLTYIMHKLQD